SPARTAVLGPGSGWPGSIPRSSGPSWARSPWARSAPRHSSGREVDVPVRSLLHYALQVPDQQVGQQFYVDFGFQDATGAANAVKLRARTQEREQVLLYEGPTKRL